MLRHSEYDDCQNCHLQCISRLDHVRLVYEHYEQWDLEPGGMTRWEHQYIKTEEREYTRWRRSAQVGVSSGGRTVRTGERAEDAVYTFGGRMRTCVCAHRQ